MYSDLEMNSNPNMSLWGPGRAILGAASIYKPETTHSPASTPDYSHSLNLERTMLATISMGLPTPSGLPTTVIAGQERHEAVSNPPVAAPLSRSINPRQGRRTKTFVDPCEIAPLKKRRIQLQYLSQDERDKVLHKREKNKVAAEKCRVKRREKMQQVRVEYEECLETNEALQAEIKRLREEEEKLHRLLKHHSCVAKQQV